MSLFDELKRRNVLQVAAAYIVVAWVIVQVAITLREAWPGMPLWIVQALIVLLALGLVPVLVFSWLYALTPGGFKRDEGVGPEHAGADVIGRRLIYVTVGAVFLGLSLWIVTRDADLSEPPAVSGDDTVSEQLSPVASPDPNSIAVLPFVNMSPDPDKEYFSDGLTEQLLHMLAQIKELRVPARTTVFSFKGQNRDVRDIAAQIGVAHVLEGSVRFAADRVRVTAQLIEASSGDHAWSGQFDRPFDDIFSIQDEIASSVAVTLVASLLNPGDVVRAGGPDTSSFAAYDYYLRARSEFHQGSYAALTVAERHLRTALEHDPGFLDAKTLLAEVVLNQADNGQIDFPTAMPRVLTLLDEVLAVNPGHPRGKAFKIFIDSISALNEGKFSTAREAEAELRSFVSRFPNDIQVRAYLAGFLRFSGRAPEAVQVLEDAIRVDPRNSDLYYQLAVVHKISAQWGRARTSLLRALELNPNSTGAWYNLGEVGRKIGDGVLFVESTIKAMELDVQDHEIPAAVADFLYQIGLPDEAKEYHDRVTRMAPESEAALALDICKAYARGGLEEAIPLAREALADLPAERFTAFHRAWPLLLYTAAARGVAQEELAWVEAHVPGFLDLGKVEVPGYVGTLRVGALDLLIATRSSSEVLDYVDRVAAHYEQINIRTENFPLLKLVVLVLENKVPDANQWALDVVFSQPPTAFRFWRLYFDREILAPVTSAPGIQEAIARWELEEAEIRDAVAAYLAARR